MTIKQAKKITECYDQKNKFYIIKCMVDNKEISESEAGFLLVDLNNRKEIEL